jgi:hypothetical protein
MTPGAYIAIVYERTIVEVSAADLQRLRRLLFERKDTTGRRADAASAIDHGLPDGTVHLEHHHALAIVEAIEELARELGSERRLLSDEFSHLRTVLLAAQDRALGGEQGADAESDRSHGGPEDRRS